MEANRVKQLSRKALLAYLVFVAPTAALAHQHGAGHEGRQMSGRMLERIDKNGDGQVGRDEVADMPRLAERFDQLDGNGDGVLDKAELDKVRDRVRGELKERGEERFEGTDTNGDGAIDRAEAQAEAQRRVAEMFDRLDDDGDGRLTREEISRGVPPPPPVPRPPR